MNGNVLKYFAGGNTAKGFSNLYDSNLRGLDRVFILSGKSSVEKAALIHKLMNEWTGKKLTLEAIYSANAPESLEGLIIRELGFGIVDGDSPREIGKQFVGDRWETIDLDVLDTSEIDSKEGIARLTAERSLVLSNAYSSYAAALKVHDEWEKLYIGQMDFSKADRVTDHLIKKLFIKDANQKERSTRRRFLGAATPVGAVDFVENITADLTNRYFLKGRAGTGKSTILKKIVQEAEKRNYDTEVYHCGFDPASLDMVVVRELGWTVFDSTQPHEYFPSREGDEVIDMYELTVAPGTDEIFASDIARIEGQYREKMKDGKMYLAKAKKLQDQIESIYQESIDHTRMNEIYIDINKEIKMLVKTSLS